MMLRLQVSPIDFEYYDEIASVFTILLLSIPNVFKADSVSEKMEAL